VDGSQSWAAYFLKKGYNVFVVDLPGVGKSSFLNENDYQVPGVPRSVRKLTGELVEQEFTASEKHPLPDGSLAWASADRHSQWPGVS
jgi:pimeloyl-ACP methyl ester carboxylesterase